MTESQLEERASILRADMVVGLERAGAVTTPQWRAAALAVPRHVFLPSFYQDAPGPDGITRYTAVSRDSDPARWLELAYEDRTWVTQLDHGSTIPGGYSVTGTPTSSSTLPSVVLRMLQDLDVPDGATVLEVGTGTGYSTALLCARLSDHRVISVEHDAGLSAVDGERLASIGYRPRLLVGDGAKGCPGGPPIDRFIATYSPGHVPPQWLEQAAPGALILVSLVGSWDAYGYVQLEVQCTTRATGRFIDSGISFMLSRETSRPTPGPLLRAAIAQRADAAATPPAIDAATLDDRSFVWAAQLALPGVVRLGLAANGATGQWFLHEDGSWAVLESSGGSQRAYQGGPRPLWSLLENAGVKWLDEGRPTMDRYGLTVTPDANTVWLDDPTNPVGQLAARAE